MRRKRVLVPFGIGTLAAFCLAQVALAQAQPQLQPPKSRRSQRVHMEEVQVASPVGNIKFTILPNAERLCFTVTRDGRDRAFLDHSEA